MAEPIFVACSATKAAWSTQFRAYARDHTTDLVVEVIVNVRSLLNPGHRSFDVLLVDDMMRLVSGADVAAAHDRQVHVIGLTDPAQGLGRHHLEELGADQIVAATVAPSELARLVRAVGPRNAQREPTRRPVARPAGPSAARRRGALTCFTPVSGGAGLSEALVAAGEALARPPCRVLVVEANEVAPVLAGRLRRASDTGLPWALAAAAQARAVFPDGLTGARADGVAPLGSFDVICGMPAPGGPAPVNPVDFAAMLTEALEVYDHVLVDTGPWLTGMAHSGRDRLGAARPALALAQRVLVFARATPDGATQLVEWRSAAHDNDLAAPVFAVLGRAGTDYERSHLAHMLGVNASLAHGFAGVHFLPEDRRLAKARWNAELVRAGPWLRAVRRLVAEVTGPVPAAPTGPVVDVRPLLATAEVVAR